MSTNSMIGKLNQDGTIRAVYSHWDGHIETNGVILHNHYNNDKVIDLLLDEGSVSSLQKYIGVKHGFDDRDPKYQEMCTFYRRDRGDYDGNKATICGLPAYNACNPEWFPFRYLWKNNQWFVSHSGVKIMKEVFYSAFSPLVEVFKLQKVDINAY